MKLAVVVGAHVTQGSAYAALGARGGHRLYPARCRDCVFAVRHVRIRSVSPTRASGTINEFDIALSALAATRSREHVSGDAIAH